MGYNKYGVQIIFRVIFIFISLLLLSYFLPKPNRVVTSIFLIILAISQVFALIRFGTKINRDVARFLIELKEKDTSELYFPESLKINFKDLHYSFQQISDEIKKARIEKLSQEQYLGYIIENISEGLISFDEDGKIKIINKAAKDLLKIEYLNSIWDLNKIQPELAKKIVLSSPDQQKLIPIIIGNTTHDFLFRISEVKIENQILKTITFQDLKKELERKEISSWKKLMRVLTHEMMNSLTPITTLSVAVRRILKNEDQMKSMDEINTEDINDIYRNNETIENRSKGLLGFIDQYRQIAKVPELKKEDVEIESFLSSINQLFSETLIEKQIQFQIEVEPKLLIFNFDKKLIEQVIINLIKNSIEALEKNEKKLIRLNAFKEKKSFIIKVWDNGTGIKSEIGEDIFVPFFTTKESGSGIGLSLAKDIMQKHNGDIYFESNCPNETSFYLKFTD